MAYFQQNEDPFISSYGNWDPLLEAEIRSAIADGSLNFMGGCGAANPNIDLDLALVSQLSPQPIFQQRIYESKPEAPVTSLPSFGKGSVLLDIQAAGKFPSKAIFSAPFSAGISRMSTGIWISPNAIEDGKEHEVGYVDAVLQWPAVQIYPEQFISPTESMFPVATEGFQAITDDEFVNGAFPSLDQFTLLMTTAHDITTNASDRLTTKRSQYPLGSKAAKPFPAATYTCSFCSHQFANKNALKKHEKTHTRPFVCSICGNRQGANRDKHRHMWAQHPEDAARMNIPGQQKTCPHCLKSFRHDNLKRHIRTLHSGVAPRGHLVAEKQLKET